MPELVCRPHAWDFSVEAGASQLRFGSGHLRSRPSRSSRYHGRLSMREQETTIWMDGRPRPPDYARHSLERFLHRRMGRRHAGADRHAPEGSVHPPVGTDAQRPGDGAHPLEAHRRLSALDRRSSTTRCTWRSPISGRRCSGCWIQNLVLPPYPCEEATETVVERGTVPHALPGQEPPARAESGRDRSRSARRTKRGSAAPRRCIRSTSPR